MSKKVIIIGGTAAGTSAAAKLRRVDRDAEIVLYEKGPIVSFGACGLPYFIGGQFDESSHMIARTPEQFEASGVRVHVEHEVVAVHKENKTIDIRVNDTGEIISDSYDVLMVATGAKPIVPQLPNADLKGIFTVTQLVDGVALRHKLAGPEVQRVAIVGAGFIGLELAEQLHHLGKEVRVIELGDRVMARVFDEEITDMLEAELEQKGVLLHLGERVTGFSGQGRVQLVETNKETYPADVVILAIGFQPNTQFLEPVGFERLANGAIVVNNKGQTSIEDIYAAGDCASVMHRVLDKSVYIPLATTANKLGRIVGENIGGLDTTFFGTLGSSALQMLGLEAMTTGITEAQAKDEGLQYKTVVVTDKDHTNYVQGATDILVKLVYDAESKVILGGQIIGQKNAVLRGDVLATAIYNRMTTTELGLLDLSYAPPFSRTWDILNVAGNVAK